MTTDGGGWTLILKINPSSANFKHAQPLWYNDDDLNATSADLSQSEAKFKSFAGTFFSEVRV